MKQIRHKVVEGATRLDTYLAEVFPQFTRNQWQDRIRQGLVTIDGKTTKSSQSVHSGSLVVLLEKTSSDEIIDNPDVIIPILYEDNDVIVINKPAGLVVYQPEGKTGVSVRSLLAEKIQGSGERDGVVHRLDRDTSGVMILAKTATSEQFLKKQFKNRLVEKHYLVLVEGHMNDMSARVELPIARTIAHYQKMRISSHGKLGILEYSVKQRYKSNDLLHINLLTGRTHQIRVQLEYLGHTVVGDRLYGAKSYSIRQFVHASSLRIDLPNGAHKIFEAPLAKDLANYLKNLEHD